MSTTHHPLGTARTAAIVSSTIGFSDLIWLIVISYVWPHLIAHALTILVCAYDLFGYNGNTEWPRQWLIMVDSLLCLSQLAVVIWTVSYLAVLSSWNRPNRILSIYRDGTLLALPNLLSSRVSSAVSISLTSLTRNSVSLAYCVAKQLRMQYRSSRSVALDGPEQGLRAEESQENAASDRNGRERSNAQAL